MAAVSAAPALLWKISHRRNSFLVKRDRAILSTHPANPTGLVRRKYDGISNLVSLNLNGNDAKGVTVVVSRLNNTNKTLFEPVAFTEDTEDSSKLNIDVRALAESVGRKDLQTALSRRITRVHRILHNKPAFPARKWSGRVSARKAALREQEAIALEKRLASKKAEKKNKANRLRHQRKVQHAQKKKETAKLEVELRKQKAAARKSSE